MLQREASSFANIRLVPVWVPYAMTRVRGVVVDKGGVGEDRLRRNFASKYIKTAEATSAMV